MFASIQRFANRQDSMLTTWFKLLASTAIKLRSSQLLESQPWLPWQKQPMIKDRVRLRLQVSRRSVCRQSCRRISEKLVRSASSFYLIQKLQFCRRLQKTMCFLTWRGFLTSQKKAGSSTCLETLYGQANSCRFLPTTASKKNKPLLTSWSF